MAWMTYFVVLSFEQGKRGLIAGEAIPVTNEENAIRMARRLSATKPAVIAFSRTGATGSGEWEDAVILAQFGNIPDGIVMSTEAA